MSEISQTSMFLSRLANLKQSQSAAVKNPNEKSAVQQGLNSGATKISTPVSEPVTIVVTTLNEKVQDLQKLLNGLDQSISSLNTSIGYVDEAIAALEEAGGVSVRARDILKSDENGEESNERVAELEKRFNSAIEKIGSVVEKSSINGVNLLKAETMVTKFDQEGKSVIETTGVDISPEALEIRSARFSSSSGIQDARIDVMNALDITTTLRHMLTSDKILIQTRQEFSQETISTLSAGANDIPIGNVGDEAANLLALQIRQQLSETSLPLAAESQQHTLKQF